MPASEATASESSASKQGATTRDSHESFLELPSPEGLERLAMLGRFAAGIAHEVNNPLGAALVNTQTALDLLPKGSPPLLKECLETTLASLQYGSEVVKSLLRFYRQEPSLQEPYDVRDVVRFVESMTRSAAMEHGCQVLLRVPRQRLRALGNPTEMKIALVNLVRNATESGAQTVTLTAARRKEMAQIRVIDDGVGIAEIHLQQLGKRFLTADQRYGGTGMGLSLVHKIVSDHGGTLEFTRNVDRGTTVRVCLPL